MMTASAVAPHADLLVASLAATGDLDAFEQLYHQHAPRIRALAGWLLQGHPAEAEDAVQEVFIRVWRKLDQYSGESAFGTWLHRLAVRVILRIRERSGRRAEIEWAVEDPAEAVGSPVGVRDHPDLRLAIEGAVGALPASAREVFVLHDMEGFTHEEIGQMLKIDPGTSRSQLHRARRKLRVLLSQDAEVRDGV